jgi:hypothetical protein
MFRVKFGESIETKIGLSRELEKDRKEDAPVILLILVTEIAVKISDRC